MGNKPDDLGDRMKKYEYITRTHLIPRMPVIIRLDGKSFHTFTRGFQRPFDDILVETMQETMKYLCENIHGCVLGYTQSDEITLVLVDYQKLETSSWFDYNIQKCASIAASMATMAFNNLFAANITKWKEEKFPVDYLGYLQRSADEKLKRDLLLQETYNRSLRKGAMFDARCFNIPKEEVCNNILWRQNDATRNSIQMVGQVYFSHSQLHGKSCNDIQDMLMTQCDINWNDYPTHLKRGSCCVRKPVEGSERTKWVVDTEIPIFKGEGRAYIDNLIYVVD